MPSDAKKKRNQKKKEAAKAREANRKIKIRDEVNIDAFLLYPGHNEIST